MYAPICIIHNVIIHLLTNGMTTQPRLLLLCCVAAISRGLERCFRTRRFLSQRDILLTLARSWNEGCSADSVSLPCVFYEHEATLTLDGSVGEHNTFPTLYDNTLCRRATL